MPHKIHTPKNILINPWQNSQVFFISLSLFFARKIALDRRDGHSAIVIMEYRFVIVAELDHIPRAVLAQAYSVSPSHSDEDERALRSLCFDLFGGDYRLCIHYVGKSRFGHEDLVAGRDERIIFLRQIRRDLAARRDELDIRFVADERGAGRAERGKDRFRILAKIRKFEIGRIDAREAIERIDRARRRFARLCDDEVAGIESETHAHRVAVGHGRRVTVLVCEGDRVDVGRVFAKLVDLYADYVGIEI